VPEVTYSELSFFRKSESQNGKIDKEENAFIPKY
jgi:hypothetical protein